MDTQPGQVITPHEDKVQPPDAVSDVVAPGTAGSSNPTAMPSTGPGPTAQTPAPKAEPMVDAASALQSQSGSQKSTASLSDDIQWSAAEFIEHPKDTRWYALLVFAGIVLAAVDYLITRDIISTIVIVIAAAMFGFYAGRKPRTQQYRLGPQGLQIGEKTYGFQNYKHFSVIDEGAVSSVVFMPMKRFEVPLTIYVSTDIEERVLDYLSTFLPMEQHRIDAVDGLLRRIKF